MSSMLTGIIQSPCCGTNLVCLWLLQFLLNEHCQYLFRFVSLSSLTLLPPCAQAYHQRKVGTKLSVEFFHILFSFNFLWSAYYFCYLHTVQTYYSVVVLVIVAPLTFGLLFWRFGNLMWVVRAMHAFVFLCPRLTHTYIHFYGSKWPYIIHSCTAPMEVFLAHRFCKFTLRLFST